MKTKLNAFLCVMMVVIAAVFTACDGDQGEIGPKGDPGAQGEQGEKGADGESGTVEAATFGNVELTVTGKDFDGKAFTEVLDFKYLVGHTPFASSWYEYEQGNKTFSIVREYKMAAKTNGRTQDEAISVIEIEVSQMGSDLVLNRVNFQAIFITNNSYFYLDAGVNSYDDDGKNFIITDYTYDEESGNLKFNFTYSYSDYNDETVEVSGKVDVIVYKTPLIG